MALLAFGFKFKGALNLIISEPLIRGNLINILTPLLSLETTSRQLKIFLNHSAKNQKILTRA